MAGCVGGNQQLRSYANADTHTNPNSHANTYSHTDTDTDAYPNTYAGLSGLERVNRVFNREPGQSQQ
jgi:hypothetical protein